MAVFRQNRQVVQFIGGIAFLSKGHISNDPALMDQAEHMPSPVHLRGKEVDGKKACVLRAILLCQTEFLRNRFEAPVNHIQIFRKFLFFCDLYDHAFFPFRK